VGDTDADQDSYVSDAFCNVSIVGEHRCGTDCDDGSAAVKPLRDRGLQRRRRGSERGRQLQRSRRWL